MVLLLLGWRVYLLVRVWGKKYSKHLPKLTSSIISRLSTRSRSVL
jgi:hypothetical protein